LRFSVSQQLSGLAPKGCADGWRALRVNYDGLSASLDRGFELGSKASGNDAIIITNTAAVIAKANQVIHLFLPNCVRQLIWSWH
jgi:hypothetical protein